MVKTIEQMTCEELTAAYVILRHLDNVGDCLKTAKDVELYVKALKEVVVSTHEKKLEDMRREFYEGRQNNVQH